MNPNEIKLTDIFRLPAPENFRLHLATATAYEHPLNVYVRDRVAWLGWNQWRAPGKNDWTRPCILSFIEFPPIANGHLFGGAFEVVSRREDGYELRELEPFSKWEGRLICTFRRDQGMRGWAFCLESCLDRFTVHQVLPEQYHGGSSGGIGSATSSL